MGVDTAISGIMLLTIDTPLTSSSTWSARPGIHRHSPCPANAMLDYIIIFSSAFLAATILPFYSEAVVAAQLMKQPENWHWIWLTASIGNTLGAVVNWMIGLYMLHFQHRSWFPFKEYQLAKAQQWFQKYGVWSLLMAWAPIGGDALTFIAGVMRVHFLVLFTLVFIGKSIRYLVVIYLTEITLM